MKDSIEKYYVYEDKKDNISYEEYLNKLKNSKYGLCLRRRKKTYEMNVWH